MLGKILVVDDEVNLRKVLSATLRREGYEVVQAEDGEQGIEVFNSGGVDVVVCDLVMPKASGFEVLRHVLDRDPDVPVILITAHGTVDSAVSAIKAGAFDYITKPFEQDELRQVIAKAARTRDLTRKSALAGPVAIAIENAHLHAQAKSLARIDGLTDLLNRRTFDQTFEAELARAARYD